MAPGTAGSAPGEATADTVVLAGSAGALGVEGGVEEGVEEAGEGAGAAAMADDVVRVVAGADGDDRVGAAGTAGATSMRRKVSACDTRGPCSSLRDRLPPVRIASGNSLSSQAWASSASAVHHSSGRGSDAFGTGRIPAVGPQPRAPR